MTASDNPESSDECKEDVRVMLEFDESDDRKRYSGERIENAIGNIKAAAEVGKQILRERGTEFLGNLTKPLLRQE